MKIKLPSWLQRSGQNKGGRTASRLCGILRLAVACTSVKPWQHSLIGGRTYAGGPLCNLTPPNLRLERGPFDKSEVIIDRGAGLLAKLALMSGAGSNVFEMSRSEPGWRAEP